MPDYQIRQEQDHWIGSFNAMASPCEIIIDDPSEQLAHRLTGIAQQEALRIQNTFSRYQQNNIVWRINHAQGEVITVDDETALLLDFAELCHQLSDGLFDITSGVLRRAWTFDGSDKLPSQTQIDALLPLVGWKKILWKKPQLSIPIGMEIDFGGIGKEYAVDRVLQLLRHETHAPVLVNFGGDLAVSGARRQNQSWQVGIETPSTTTNTQVLSPPEAATHSGKKIAANILELSAGALATSGDSRRFLWRDGIRYSHILNPFTGYPVQDAPRSITVAGSNCVQAGMLATFGLLQGAAAEKFLHEQEAIFWCLR